MREQGTDSYIVKNALYYPQSLINILSVTEFSKQLDDMEGTGIGAKQLRLRFYWENNKFSWRINHPESNLPEVQIREGYGVSSYFTAMINKVGNTATV